MLLNRKRHPQEVANVQEWISSLKRFWSRHLARIRQAAQQKAKQFAARQRAGSNHQPPSKEH